MITPRRLIASAARRVLRLTEEIQDPPTLLEMLWPTARLDSPPPVSIPAGYALRQFRPGDREGYFALITAAGMDVFQLEHWENLLLPDGFFVVEHAESCALAATCMAAHRPSGRHPRAGNLGWLAADPAHKGRGLGRAVAAAVTARLIAGAYRRIYLETHDFRLAAIRTYLTLGWVPFLYREDMHDRWKVVCKNLGWAYTADQWPRGVQETLERLT